MENKGIILPVILALGLIFLSSLLVYQNTEIKDQKIIQVAGSYHSNVNPDQGEITFRVITRGETAGIAQQENSKIAEGLVKSLKDAGLSDKEIQTTAYLSHRRSVWENNTYVEKDYEVTNSMQIKTKSLDKLGNIIDLASKNGIKNIDSLYFSLSEEKKEQLYQEALVKAGENARQRVDALGKSLGFKVKAVKTVSLNGPTTPYYNNYAMNKLADTTEMAVAATPIQPREVDLNVMVTVTYLIT